MALITELRNLGLFFSPAKRGWRYYCLRERTSRKSKQNKTCHVLGIMLGTQQGLDIWQLLQFFWNLSPALLIPKWGFFPPGW